MDRDGSRVGLDGRRCLTIDFFFLRTLTLFFLNKIQLPFFFNKNTTSFQTWKANVLRVL